MMCYQNQQRDLLPQVVLCSAIGLLSLTGGLGCSQPTAEGEATEIEMAAAIQQVENQDREPERDAPMPSVEQTPIKIQPVRDKQTFDEHVRPFFAAHCVKCHGEETAEAKLRLDTLGADFVRRPEADHWVEILDRLNLGEMPPQDQPQPDPKTLAKVVDWITSELEHARTQSQSTGGRVLLRRITRREYANTVRDLLNVEFPSGTGPLEDLPPDGSIGGFDRVSKALLLDPSLMETYLKVAQKVVEKAVVFRPPLIPERTLRFEFERTPNTAMSYIPENRAADIEGDFLVMMEGAARTFAKLRHPYNDKEIPLTGRYRVRVRAAADSGKNDQPVFMDVTYGSEGRQARFRVKATKAAPQIYEFEKLFDSFTPGEFHVGIVDGERFTQGNAEWYQRNSEIRRLAEAGKLGEATRLKARMRAEGAYDTYVRGSYLPSVLNLAEVPKLYLDWIEIVGPLQGEYPPPSMALIFGDSERAARFAQPGTDSAQVLEDAREIFHRLLPRAFRRPVKDSEVQAITELVSAEMNAGADPQEAIKTGLVAVLCSPDFLYLFEPGVAPQTPRRLTNYELATRLSYFLWSTMPDTELLRLAESGSLQSEEELAKQVDRMLADDKIQGFIDGFARQWFKVDEFDRFPPDQQIYPDYYATDMAGVQQDIKREPLAFFREVLTKDEPVSNFLNSNWLMLNERLAKLYEVPGVTGSELRRVSLPQGPASERRGGLLGMAGVHLWGADGNRTKPVERGKYLLTVLFNSPPPPPPPNAGEVEPNLGGEKLTVRERLARHREQTTCNNCHRRIDPYGLAMEHFNAIGQWRERLDGEKPLRHWGENRPVIDVSGTLPNGRTYSNFSEFKTALVDQEQRFHRALAEKLLTYALGRTKEASDRPVIDGILATMREEDPTFRTMLKAVIRTKPFREK